MVLGSGFTINDPLINNIDQSLMIGFGSTKPTLFVGPSTGVSNTGRIGIGNVTAPQAKLHIRADANEPAPRWRGFAIRAPVEEGLVFKPEDYLCSSAVNYAGGKGLFEVTLLS